MSKIRGNDDNFNNYTSTEEQMSRSRTSSSSMDTLSPPGSLSSSPESHQKTFSSRSSEDNVFTPDRLPFSLDQVRRSPRLIVENKLRKQSSLTPSRSGDQVQQTEKSITTKDEDMIKMRLFYLGIIKDLADVNKKADTTAIKQLHTKKDFKSLKRRKSDIIFEVDKVRGLIFQSEQRIAALTRHLDSIVLEINCLQSLSKEEEDRTLETLKSYYLDMSKSLDGLKFEDQSSLLKTSTSKGKGSYGSPGVFTKHFNFSSGSSSTFSPPAALSSTVSFTPPPLTPGSSFSPPNRELSFSSTLLALAGQLTELCQVINCRFISVLVHKDS